MKKSLIVVALAGAFSGAALADAPASPHTLTANVGVVSDYVFRGISQSQHQPAVQAGADYAHVSGFYAGVWGSSIEWTDRKDLQVQKGNRVELDLYGGYKRAFGDFGLDVGAIRYFYPGEFQPGSGVTANTTEAYVGGSWKFVSLKYNHVVSNSIFNWGGTAPGTKTEGSGYTDLTVTYPVNDTVNVIGHLGRQNIKNYSAASYTDWKLGVTKDFGIGIVGVSYTGTNAKGDSTGDAYRWAGKDASRDVLALSFTKNF